MADLNRDSLAFILGFIDLADWAWGNGDRIKLLEDLIDIFSELGLESLGSILELVAWSLLPKVHESHSHFFADDVPSVTEVLEALNPDDPGSFDGPYEQREPDILSPPKEVQWQQQYRGREDGDEL